MVEQFLNQSTSEKQVIKNFTASICYKNRNGQNMAQNLDQTL